MKATCLRPALTSAPSSAMLQSSIAELGADSSCLFSLFYTVLQSVIDDFHLKLKFSDYRPYPAKTAEYLAG